LDVAAVILENRSEAEAMVVDKPKANLEGMDVETVEPGREMKRWYQV